jgi:mitochondrial chaperone BCS1
MMFWLSSLPQFRQFRDFSVSTNGPSLENSALEVDGDDNLDETLRRRSPDATCPIPSILHLELLDVV